MTGTWQSGAPVAMSTARFRMRSLTREDVGAHYLDWLADAEIMRFVNARAGPRDADDVRAFVASHDNASRFLLGIFTKDGGEHIGNCTAACDLFHRRADLGVLIGARSWWGKGVVIETRARCIQFLFEDVGLLKVTSQVYASNRAAVFNAQALGFELEGTLRRHVTLAEGRDDVLVFALHRDRWAERTTP